MITNGGRKWYYHNPSKPWKGGYWSPLLPNYPPYNEYQCNPKTCRFEHKETGEPLYPWQKAAKHSNNNAYVSAGKTEWDWNALGMPEDKVTTFQPEKKKELPEWLRFILEENLGSIMERRRRRKLTEKRDRENGIKR